MTTYMICATLRCGSTWLCELLRSTRRLGAPKEYFSVNDIPKLKEKLGVPADASKLDYWATAVEKESTNGVMGLKVMPWAAEEGYAIAGPTHFVRMIRRDVLGQAISAYRAQHTGIWHKYKECKVFNPDAIDVDRIRDIAANIRRFNAEFWPELLAKWGVSALELVYEDMLSDPTPAVLSVAQHVGVVLPEDVQIHAFTKIMRDEWTEETRKLVEESP